MLCLSKKTEYALAALAYLAEQSHRVASAREIAESAELPPAMLEKILKCMQHHGLLLSTRGAAGGYRIVVDLNEVTLLDLVAMMECPDKPGEECGCLEHAADPSDRMRFSRNRHGHAPVVALQYKLVRFLKDVKLSDLVLPGRRIDVPAERLGSGKSGASQRRYAHADHAH
jgi:Rrf2 family protein